MERPRRAAGAATSREPGAVARSVASGGAASLREGLEDTLTLLRLGVKGTLLLSLRSTNAIESLNDKIATYTRRVKRWQGGK